MGANPILLKSHWVKAECSGKAYGPSAYSPIGEYVYRRRVLSGKVEYSRVPYSKICLLNHWYEIDETLWETVDVFGFPIRNV